MTVEKIIYDGPVTPFLVAHLSGVIPGAFLKGREWTRRVRDIFRSSDERV
jgi:hypothetical protein